jgi:hypothetical protein
VLAAVAVFAAGLVVIPQIERWADALSLALGAVALALGIAVAIVQAPPPPRGQGARIVADDPVALAAMRFGQ